MGLTSRAKRGQMKVKDPSNVYLTEGGLWPVGGTVRRSDFILPRVEAEIAVVTSRPLRGPGCTIAQVQASIDYVLPALELIDSRYPNYGFDLASVIRSEEHTSELQSLMRISYAVFCLKKKT